MSVCHLHVFCTIYTIVASWSVCPWLSKALGKLQWTAPEAALSCPRIWKFSCFRISWAGFQLEPTASFEKNMKFCCNSGFKHITHWKLSVDTSKLWRVWRFADANKVASNCLLKAIPSAARPNKSRSSSNSKILQKSSPISEANPIPWEFHDNSICFILLLNNPRAESSFGSCFTSGCFCLHGTASWLGIKNAALPELFKAGSVLHWQNLHSWLCWPRGSREHQKCQESCSLTVHTCSYIILNSSHYLFWTLSQFTDQFSFAEKATFPKTTCHPKGSHSRSDLRMGSLREARKRSFLFRLSKVKWTVEPPGAFQSLPDL